MAISFTAFTNIAQAMDNSNQKVTKSGSNLRSGTDLKCFRIFARGAENRETSKAFVESIRNHDRYRSYLPNVAKLTHGIENSSRPLTARTIRAVETSLTRAYIARRTANEVAANALLNKTDLLPNTIEALKIYCNEHNLDMASMDPIKAFSLTSVHKKLQLDGRNFLQPTKPMTYTNFKQEPFILTTLKELLQDADVPTLADLSANVFHFLHAKLNLHSEVLNCLNDDCQLMNNPDMQKAVNFLSDNFRSGLIPRVEVPKAIHHMTHLDTSTGIKLPGANLATTAGCEKALTSAAANTAATMAMVGALESHGLPTHLATSLALHPKVVADVTPALAALDFQADDLLYDIARIMEENAMKFVADNKTELAHIVEQFTQQKIAKETQASIVNTVLGTKGFMGSVLVEGSELKPEAFIDNLKSFTQNLQSSAHGLPLNAQQIKAKLQHVMDFYLAQTGVSKADAFKRIHDQYAPLMQNMAAIMRNDARFNENRAMKKDFIAQYDVLRMLAETTQPYVTGSPEAENNPVFESKTQSEIFQEFTDKIMAPAEGRPARLPVGNKQLDPLTIALGQTFTTGQYNMAPALFGSMVHRNHESYRAVMGQYFDGMADENIISGNPTVPAAPNALLTAFINEHKADCGLTDRDGLSVDLAKVNINTLFKAARTAYNDHVRDTKGIVTPAQGTLVIQQALIEALTSMGQAMTGISQNAYIEREDKQAMLDMALATELRTAQALDCVYTLGLRRTVIKRQSLMDKIATLAGSPLALGETLPLFIFETLAPSLSGMPTTLRDIDGFGKGIGLEELVAGLGHIIANSGALSAEQRLALFDALDAEATRHTVGGLCSGMNAQLVRYLHGIKDEEMSGRIIDKYTNNTKVLACITALRDQLATRIAKDKHMAIPEAQPEAYTAQDLHIPKAQCSSAVLRACTYRLGAEASLVLTPLDYALADKSPRPSEAVFAAAGKVLSRMHGSFNDDFMHSLIARHADELATASGTIATAFGNDDEGDDSGDATKELSPREIYTILTGKKAPYFLSENEMAAKIQEAVLGDFRPSVLMLAPHTEHDEVLHINMVTAALRKGLSAQTLNALLKGDRLTLDSVEPQVLTMQGLENYNATNGHGLITEHPQKHPESSITFTDKHGNGKALMGRRNVFNDGNDGDNWDDGEYAHDYDLYQSILTKAAEFGQNAKQSTVIMQSIGFASTRIFAELGQALAANVQKDGQFTHALQQNADDSVDVTVTMLPQDVFYGSLTLNIDPEGNVKPTAFDFGLDLVASTRMAQYQHLRPTRHHE